MAVLSLPCCEGFSLVAVGRGCSSLGEQGTHCCSFSSSRAQATGMRASVVAASGL